MDNEVLSQADRKKAEELLVSPPKGTWVKRKHKKIIIGVSFFCKKDLILLPFYTILLIPFIGFIVTAIRDKNIIASLLDWAIFLIPSGIIACYLIFDLFGKVEIVLSKNVYVFIGLWIFGKKKYIDWDLFQKIYVNEYNPDSFNNYKRDVFIVENKTIKIPMYYTPKLKSDFFILMLKYYMEKKELDWEWK